ncbi:hypothetical protein BCR36DRAFT_586989 [Piromyces finnis]|uniref:W2 domain-containing protein n=1 Tax=Piromyces finnis TaxID=1754191 RepID=A0A1Y1UYH6_9FUNG|nr:hypothetical protein BCR36DRAFT_586989 [Piromyces finnis]|eukprot:ORX42859.1 hypothetical protein BCR36DRAFT_586989 [Piromyces finnis]
MQSQTQTISIPVLISQLGINVGKSVRNNSSVNSPTKTTTKTTTKTSYRSPSVKTIYRTNNINNQKSVYVSVSSSSSVKTTTTSTTTKDNNNMYIKRKPHSKEFSNIQYLLSLFIFSFKYIFIISYNIIEKLLFVVLNPFESIIFVSYRINEIRLMNNSVEELKFERDQLIIQGDQLLAQLNAIRICYRNVESSYRAMKQKRDTLKETIKALQNEIQRERESRFVVEKCHSERIEKLEFEIDMKDQEIIQYEDKERLMKRKIHKLKKKLRNKTPTSSSKLTLPTFSLQNFNTFSFDDVIPSNGVDIKNEEENNSSNYSDSSSEGEDFVFEKESDTESFSSESSSEEETDSDSYTDSESESDSDLDEIYESNIQREIPKNSIYYNFGQKHSAKEEEEEEEVNNNKIEQLNPLEVLRKETYNCLYQSLVSELCTSSILMDLDIKMDKNNFNSYTCISIIMEAFIHYLEAKNQITNKEAIENLFIRYRSLILNYTDSKEDQMNLLVALEYICIENSLRLQQHLRIMMAIYKAELVDPNTILQWYRLLPDAEEVCHHTCPMTPNINCILPNNNDKLNKSYVERNCKSLCQMIDGHYATQTVDSSKDNATIQNKSQGEGFHDDIKSEAKAFTDSLLLSAQKDNESKFSAHSIKFKNNSHGTLGHARKRSISKTNDSDLELRKDVRELAKFFALWLESKETSSSDDESILDSISQEFDESSSEDSGNELRNLHRSLLSDDDSKSSHMNDSETYSDIVSVVTEDEQYPILSPKKYKKVTFNLIPMDDKDDDATVHNEDETEHNNDSYNVAVNKSSPLVECLENNPLREFNCFDFPEMEYEENEEEEEACEFDDEVIIEEVEEIIEEEEVIEEEIIEEVMNSNEENYDQDDESVTVVEEKEVIDEVIECVKVTN